MPSAAAMIPDRTERRQAQAVSTESDADLAIIGGGALVGVVGLVMLLRKKKPTTPVCTGGTVWNSTLGLCVPPTALPPTVRCPTGSHVAADGVHCEYDNVNPPPVILPPAAGPTTCDSGGIGLSCASGDGRSPCNCPGAGGGRPPCCVTSPSPGGPTAQITPETQRTYILTEDSGWSGGGEWIYHPNPNEFENEIAYRIETDTATAGNRVSCPPSQLQQIAHWWNGIRWVPFTESTYPPAGAPVYVGSKQYGLCR